MTEAERYKNHLPGSRKGKVHRRFDEAGREAAFALGVQLGIKESSLISWFSMFVRGEKKKAGRKKRA